ncbi:MAG: hypothetical protein ACP5OC_08955 [Thermoplasmata archaeon]
MVRIFNLKKNFVRRFPLNPAARILETSPDEVPPDAFLALAQAALAVVGDEK